MILEYGYIQNNSNEKEQQYISKVIRLIDNTVWSVGEEIKMIGGYKPYIITSFRDFNNLLLVGIKCKLSNDLGAPLETNINNINKL